MRGTRTPAVPVRQQGVVLIISLALLAVLAVVAVTVSSTATLELRMAENDRLRQLLLTRAERALQQGREAALATFAASPTQVPETFDFSQDDAFYAPPGRPYALPTHPSRPEAWSSFTAAQAGGPNDLYVVEYLGCYDVPTLPGEGCEPPYLAQAMRLFRITAMSREGLAASILQEVVAVRYPVFARIPIPSYYQKGRVAWTELGIEAL